MKKIKFDDTYTDDDVRTINALMFITSLIMMAMFGIAQMGGLL